MQLISSEIIKSYEDYKRIKSLNIIFKKMMSERERERERERGRERRMEMETETESLKTTAKQSQWVWDVAK